jgi:hypothetical protein
MAANLTVANSSLVLSVEGLYPKGLTLQGYAADNVFEVGAVENKEIVMGIDGNLSAGFVYNPQPITLTLQADSPSLEVFEQIWQRESSNREALRVGLTIALPSVNKRFVGRNGFLTSYQAPSGQRLLQPGVAVFNFARLEFSKIS